MGKTGGIFSKNRKLVGCAHELPTSSFILPTSCPRANFFASGGFEKNRWAWPPHAHNPTVGNTLYVSRILTFTNFQNSVKICKIRIFSEQLRDISKIRKNRIFFVTLGFFKNSKPTAPRYCHKL